MLLTSLLISPDTQWCPRFVYDALGTSVYFWQILALCSLCQEFRRTHLSTFE